MLIVLAVTSRIAKTTAMPTVLSRLVRFPIRLVNSARNAPSVSVFVWTSLFSKLASIARMSAAPCDGFAIWMLNVPAPAYEPALSLIVSYRYLKWKNAIPRFTRDAWAGSAV
ncbi:MAG: hypothetical protein DMF94_21215 [Acidobacteria bacterium]|nr:MAG: hypothetical protein DMF94_21215 [Acidobacteriota bacterium]